MAIDNGPSYSQDQLSIGQPDIGLLQAASIASDVRVPVEYWVSEASRHDDILCFSIFLGRDPIGQILLHDLNMHTGESLVAYHPFDLQLRGRGLGTQALQLLKSYVLERTTLKKLIMITSRDNLASQKIALKCGFRYAGVLAKIRSTTWFLNGR